MVTKQQIREMYGVIEELCSDKSFVWQAQLTAEKLSIEFEDVVEALAEEYFEEDNNENT
jgi:hypothetical protein